MLHSLPQSSLGSLAVKRLLVLLLVVLVCSGCGGVTAEPTATPTKTPFSTPTVAPATPTPTIVPPTPTVALAEPTATPTPPPDDIAPFTGLQAENKEYLQQRPVFICINNDTGGRAAHYGLSAADIVYEFIVDGFSMTRLTAMYQSKSPSRVGPVRSARLPNIWMTYMYDGVLACSGGSDAVRYLLKNEVGFPYLDADIDDPSNNRYFQSIGNDYRTRMQASPDGVRRWLTDNNLNNKVWSRPGFLFNEVPPANSAGEANLIRIAYPGGNQVEWRYNPALNGYVRLQGGVQQMDPMIGQPIVAQNVIMVVAAHQLTDIVEDSLGSKGVNIELYGFGDFRIFRDGQMYEGTWRADDVTPPRWFGPGEALIELKPGQSWIQVVRQLNEVTYQ
jgi:hypothetical protein